VFVSSNGNRVPSLAATVQMTRLNAWSTFILSPLPKVWRKLLRAPELSDIPFNPVKPKESPGKFAATAVLG